MVPTYLARVASRPEASAVTRSALSKDYCMHSRQLPQSKIYRAGGQRTVDSSGNHLIYHKWTRYPKNIPDCTFDSGLLQLNPTCTSEEALRYYGYAMVKEHCTRKISNH